GRNGSLAQASRGPEGTTSVCPGSPRAGPSPLPCAAQRLSTSPWRSDSQAKPARRRRAASNAWQPASSGVTEGRAISSQARSRTSLMLSIRIRVAAGRRGMASADAEQLLEAVVGEALAEAAVLPDHHRAAHQLRMLAQQQLPLRLAARRLAALRQLAPGGGGLVDQGIEAAGLARPLHQGLRRGLVVA